ncbi:MAG TPA: efflux RND transporter periplasmic adaptor subunit [Myxococcaceae bacterium]|nr:efflux RND transporter periplasmic adaptor subunit [Myxococcaceae bacterium]
MAETPSEQAPHPGSPARGPARRHRSWILVGIAILVVLGVVLLRRARGDASKQPAGPGAQARVVPVGVSAAEKRDVSIWVEGLGNVTSLATVTIRARVSGQIVSIAFQEGSRVRQGDLLVQVDPRPFKIALQQAEATTQRDLATLHNAERDLARYKDLIAQKLIAQQQYDQQIATVESARATIGLDQAAVNSARLNLQFSSVISPIDGIAGVRQVDVGNLVTPTDQNGIVVLTQMDPIAVLFTLPQDDLPRVAEAFSSGPLTVEAWDRGGLAKLGTGKLTVIDNQVNAGTATIRLKAEFPNPELRLWPSLFVKARMQLQTRAGVVVVPTPAIQRGPNGVFVYLVNPDGTVAVRTVQVDTVQGPLTIVAQGVQPGERVVVDGQNQLRAGAKVDARPVPMPAGQGEQTPPPAAPRPQAERGQPDAQGQRTPAPGQAHQAQQGAPREASVQ